MTTKYDIGDHVRVGNVYLGAPWKYFSEVKGVVKAIHVNHNCEERYCIQLYYPDGATVRGVDVSGMEVPCAEYFNVKKIIGKEETNDIS